MGDTELKRRKVHGVLSSKSLLEALERLTVNKDRINHPTNSRTQLKSKEVIFKKRHN
jgi:hypothetical protein